MAKQPKDHQVMRHDGDTGKATAVTKFLTAKGAAAARHEKKKDIPVGSSDWVNAERTRRKGRG
jgi:hypothetical protein